MLILSTPRVLSFINNPVRIKTKDQRQLESFRICFCFERISYQDWATIQTQFSDAAEMVSFQGWERMLLKRLH